MAQKNKPGKGHNEKYSIQQPKDEKKVFPFFLQQY